MVDPILFIAVLTTVVTIVTCTLQIFQSAKIHNINSNCCSSDIYNRNQKDIKYNKENIK